MIEVKNLCAYYKLGSQKKIIFEDISFTIKQNSFVALCGKNGSGKSTLLSLLDGIIPDGVFIEGKVLLNGKDIFSLKRKTIAQNISYLIQSENPIWNITVKQFLETGFYSLEETTKLEREQKIFDALKQFDILHLENKKILQISGGEFQKCRLARSFVLQSKVLLFDEPVENLDAPYQNRLLKLLSSLQSQKTILFSIHDMNLASIYANDFILFDSGKVILGSRKDIFTQKILSSAYQTDVKIYMHPELNKEQVMFM